LERRATDRATRSDSATEHTGAAGPAPAARGREFGLGNGRSNASEGD
jgi:hypothetical protein